MMNHIYDCAVYACLTHTYTHTQTHTHTDTHTHTHTHTHTNCAFFPWQDWWQCMDYQTWFRKWNYLVYDWLNVYLYADIKSVSGKWRRRRGCYLMCLYIVTFERLSPSERASQFFFLLLHSFSLD